MPVVGQEVEEMFLEHLGYFDDERQARADCPRIPLLEESQGSLSIRALPKVPEVFLECPSPAHLQILGEQLAQAGTAFAVEVLRGVKKDEALTAQHIVSFTLEL